MEIKQELNGTSLTLYVSGRLDATTAIDFDKTLNTVIADITELTLDLTDLEYIASAGLRSLLAAQKTISKQGSMKLRNISPEVQDVLDMTGFSDFLTIEPSK